MPFLSFSDNLREDDYIFKKKKKKKHDNYEIAHKNMLNFRVSRLSTILMFCFCLSIKYLGL